MISNPAALLRRLLQEEAEAPWLEFKKNNCSPEHIAESISGCANAAMLLGKERAFIVWGIEDKTKRRVGTDVRLAAKKMGGVNLMNWLTQVIEPQLMLEAVDFEDDGLRHSILAIEPSYDRPVTFRDASFIRIGENTKSLKNFREHERSLWLITAKRKFENAIAAPHQSGSQIPEKLDTDAFYRLSKEEKPQNNGEIVRRFAAAGFVKDDMEGGYDITNMGALLFARDIREFPSIAAKSVRVIRYAGADKRESLGETEGRQGYAVGFVGLLRYVTQTLPRKEVYVEGVRRMDSVYSEIAIREVIANALIHQDFTIGGSGPVVEIYADRIEVTNPGNSLIEVDRIIDERRSRNESLGAAMRTLGICEERGGGIDKAIIDIEERFLPAPEFTASENSMRVVIFGPKKFEQLSKADKIWSCFCHCVVRWIRHDYMSNTTLRDRFSLAKDDYQAVSDVIANARQAGRIVPAESDQGKRNAKYVPYWAR